MSSSLSAPPLRVAAADFAVVPEAGQPADFSQTGQTIRRVVGDLRTTVILLETDATVLCLVSSPLPVDGRPLLRGATKAVLGRELGLAPAQIVCACTHAHTMPLMLIDAPAGWDGAGDAPGAETNALGRAYLAGLRAAARGLRARLAPATIAWGVAPETRVTYNRRGRRPDGRSYFIREEDRLLLDPGYIGEIDADAPVVLFRDPAGRALAALVLFTGHPVTAYNPEEPVAFGQWSQVAAEKLSAHLGGAPVAFLQGCAGDINSKYMLTGTVGQALELGGFLGDTFIRAAESARPSRRGDFAWKRLVVPIPLAELPDTAALERSLAEIDAFLRRAEAGDENTRECVGMNFPRALSPIYRARLVDPVRRWYVWALEQRRSGRAGSLPRTHLEEAVVARIGDVGLTAFRFEAFVKTGLKIKREAPLPLVLTACYTEGGQGYIPDATACDDREYQAGYFRYLPDRSPYQAPGGDAAATAAVAALRELSA